MELTKKTSLTAGTYSDGYILFSTHGKFQTSCTLQLRTFPFDTQNCIMNFRHTLRPEIEYGDRSIHHGVTFKFRQDVEVRASQYMENSEWEITGMKQTVHNLTSQDLAEELTVRYPSFDIQIDLKRRYNYYVITLLLPLIWNALLSASGFLLPTESGERVSLGVTVFLSYMFLLLVVIDVIPPTSNNFPILG